MADGIGAEMRFLELGDKRLAKRGTKIIEALAKDPAASINAACRGWGDTLAAYRFFDNPNVKPEAILASHREATEVRIDQHPTVLLVQDTTELDFSAHPTSDSGVLNNKYRQGMFDHSHIAFTPEGLSLGVIQADFFDRTVESLGKAAERKPLPLEQKETFRWLQGYRLACEVQRDHPNTHIISVADCEADIYEIFLEHGKQPAPADFVIRAKQDRRCLELDNEAGIRVFKKVRDEVAASEIVTVRHIDLPPTPKREARQARLEVRAKQVVVKPPHMREHLGPVTYNLVLVAETGRPADDKTAVEWLLITTLPIDSVEDVLRVVDHYVGRWPIEVYFRIFKTGCQVEEIQLTTNDRLKRCLMFYKVIAWRIAFVTYLGREYPKLGCDQVFTESEWKSVWRIVTRKKLPKTPPPLVKFIPVLAELGGYNNRNSDTPPGPKPLWIAIRRMHDFAQAWEVFHTDEE